MFGKESGRYNNNIFKSVIMAHFERVPILPLDRREEEIQIAAKQRPAMKLVYDKERPELSTDPRILEKQKLIDQYLAVADIYSHLEKMAQSRKPEQVLSSEEQLALEDIIQKFVALKPLITITLDQARAEFKNLLLDGDSKKINNHAARYAEYAVEAESDLIKEKARLTDVYSTPERFHGPEDGAVTVAARGLALVENEESSLEKEEK